MTYSAFIDRLNQKLRDQEAWPEAASATGEQVYLSWIAGISVATQMPMSSFSLFEEVTLSSPTTITGQLEAFELPADLFHYREDMGLRAIRIDGVSYSVLSTQPYQVLVRLAGNKLYQESTLFTIDIDQRRFFALGAGDIEIEYLRLYQEPAIGDIATTDYPLEGPNAERAASIVAYHVSGETIRDSAMSQFQAILSQEYAARPQPQVESEQ